MAKRELALIRFKPDLDAKREVMIFLLFQHICCLIFALCYFWYLPFLLDRNN